jgi:HAD superfamily hydrolase (TIGR01509 family)
VTHANPAVPHVDLVIFDCDGVLVDTEPIAIDVDLEVLADLGLHLSREEVVERFVGHTDADVTAQVEVLLGRPSPASWDHLNERRYRDAFAARLQPVDGIVEVLDAIEHRVPYCVASNGDHDKIRFTLGLTGLLPRFDGRIFSVQDVARGKPAPDLFLHAAATMGADPADTLVVEDSPAGIAAAQAAGMQVRGYVGSVIPRRLLEATGALLVDDLREVVPLLR